MSNNINGITSAVGLVFITHRRQRHRFSSSSPHERCGTTARRFTTLPVTQFHKTNIECIRSQHMFTNSVSASWILVDLTRCESHSNPSLSLSTVFPRMIYVLVPCSGQKCWVNTKGLFRTAYWTFHSRPVVLNGFHDVFFVCWRGGGCL